MSSLTSKMIVWKYLLVVLIVSIPFWVLGAFSKIELLPGLPVSALMVITPLFVATIFTFAQEGRAGLWRFLAQSFDAPKMHGWAWVVVLCAMPSAMVLSAILQIASGRDLPPMVIDVSQTLILFAIFFLAATAEELGWTGFATRRLLEKQGFLIAALIIGIAAVIWHVVPLLQAGRGWDWIAWWALATMSRRILIVWVYAKGGRSVFGASLFHTMSNLTWMLFPVMGSHYDPSTTGLVLLVYAALVLIFMSAVKPSSLSPPSKRTQ